MLGWDLYDIVTFSKRIRVTENRSVILPENATIISEWSKADMILYEYFRQKLDRIISYNRDYIREEVEKLRLMRDEMYEKCMVKLVKQKPEDVKHRTDVLEYSLVLNKIKARDVRCMLRTSPIDELLKRFMVIPNR